MFSSRRKQLMLLGMNMLIYVASKMITRNYMKLLELDNVVDEERLLLSRQYNYCSNPYLQVNCTSTICTRRRFPSFYSEGEFDVMQFVLRHGFGGSLQQQFKDENL